ncbi:hypothetical protein AVEN_15851-1 [Araneus ventricosus]|uniref:Uncharacterized protein n=1 Tax=Araneus ventricosus TaxID=182803 RepID=A0A4Y2KMK9_ARAVE|nr:hypothetical protein AVEN_15851-1 [Araneus ventricosus]
MNRIKRHVHFLHVLTFCESPTKKFYIKIATNEQIKTLCEIYQNVLAGNVSKAKVRQLYLYKKVIRQLADRNIPIARKRKLLTNQTGGFFTSHSSRCFESCWRSSRKTDRQVNLKEIARKMEFVPKELVSEYYQLNKPEIRVEDIISNLLHDEETPDDMKARLLSHWIPKYQRLMQPPPPTKPFEIPKELLQEREVEQEEKPTSLFSRKKHDCKI